MVAQGADDPQTGVPCRPLGQARGREVRTGKKQATARRLLPALLCALMVIGGALAPACVLAVGREDSLTVGIPADRCPIFYSDAETGEPVGIGVDLMRAVAEEAGYPSVTFEFISERNHKDALDNPGYDLVMPFGTPIDSTSGRHSVVSESLMQTPFTLVIDEQRQKLPPLNSLRVGMLSSLSGVAESIKETYPGTEIAFYDTMEESVRALRSNEVDALLNNSYVWSYVLQKPAYSDLSVQPTTMVSMDFRIGTVDTPGGRETIARIDDGISRLSDTRRQAVILDYTSRRLYRYDMGDYVHEYGLAVALGIALLAAIVVIAVQKQRALHARHEKEMRSLVDHDELTGLLSLSGFKKRVTELLQANPDIPYILSYSNIRNFKYVNDTLGRDAGDALLLFWTAKVQEFLLDEDAIGRIDGDHIVILHRLLGEDRVTSDEKDIVEDVRDYFVRRGGGNRLQVCSGIYVLTPEDYREADIDQMIDFAREAERHVRDEQGDGIGFYNPKQWEQGRRAVDIVGHLPEALRNQEIQVWYQPQVNYETGEVIGAEALCRWNHATLGWVSPAEFIPLLEEANLVYDLDRYVWEGVCRDLARWNRQGSRRVVSINVSRHDIEANGRLPEYLHDCVLARGLSVDQLHIEITETAYMEHPETLITATREFRELGFQVEMDDFGSGYSSLNMLKEVPVDRVKLDLKFLSNAGDAERGRIIVNYVIQMVEALKMSLIAEGVENAVQAGFLESHGCHEMQGFFFHKPMSRDEFEVILGHDGETDSTGTDVPCQT